MANALVMGDKHKGRGGHDFGQGGDVEYRIDMHRTPGWRECSGAVSLMPDEFAAMANTDDRTGNEAILYCLLKVGMQALHNKTTRVKPC